TGLGDIWSVMNGLPVGGETLEMMNQFQEQFNLNAVMDSGIMDQLKQFDGQWVLNVTDESNKINVNNCANGRCEQTSLRLEALSAAPAAKQLLEAKKLTGRELAFRIKDYIYSKPGGTSEASGFNDKNEPYNKRNPKQMAKQAPLDSVEELRMIEGWDQE